MQPNNDLFDLFREGQSELNEKPPQASWRRLERRLNTHQRRTRLAFRRNVSIAAAIAIVIGMTFLISFSIGQQNQLKRQASAVVLESELEEFTLEEGDPAAYRIVEFARTYQNRPSLYIREGEANKKLQVRN